MEPYDTVPVTDVFAASTETFEYLLGELAGPGSAELSHARLEEMIEVRGRLLLRQLLQDHLDLRAAREEQALARQDAGAAGRCGVAGADGVLRRCVESGHHRLLATVFGTASVRRCAFRARGVRNVYPADAALSLPGGRHSHGLTRLAVTEAVRGSFDGAKAAIEARCGPVLGKRQLEQLVKAAAADIGAFYRQKIPVPCTAGTLLVLSVDGKGIVMRPEALRPTIRKAAAGRTPTFRTRLAAGEKPCRKRMATLGVVYDADPAPRRPHDVIAVPGGRRGRRPPRAGPHARGKWLCGSVIDDPATVIEKVFDHAEARDPAHVRPWVVLVDGARHQLDLIRAEAARRNVSVGIVIDFVHVLEYLWAAARSLHPAADPAAEDWVAGCALAVLAGNAGQVTDGLTAQAAVLPAGHRRGIDTCIRYLAGHAEFLRYDQALENGWPIATGVIEGACRHLIGDRLDITGARWGLAGAEAILQLRALIACGDFRDYWKYHLRQEHQHTYNVPA
ncbi:ISKra4 family transposase [Streptosporangium sp. G11]|uniref:ISKra4 family transposase n=1 Tax=Streptosporangium sp. G11 TaxID=3436926 RepID=UPI003EB764C8